MDGDRIGVEEKVVIKNIFKIKIRVKVGIWIRVSTKVKVIYV